MTYTDEQVKQVAAVAWAADAELQAQHGDPAPSLPGDTGDADAHGVTFARVRAVLEGATPEELHERWRRAREAQGWTLGPKADSQRKTHPDLVPYADRPEHLKARDRVFAAIVREVAGQDAPELAAVYRERARLVAYLAACYPSVLVHGADPETGDWPVIFVDTPAGQLTWHLTESDLGLFAHVRAVHVAESGGRPKWDGHTTEEKYERLAELIPHAMDARDEPQPAPELDDTRKRAEAAERELAQLADSLGASVRAARDAERKRIRELADRTGAVCTGDEGTSFYFSALLADKPGEAPDA